MGSKGSSAPAAPDPYRVAGAQSQVNQQTARLNAELNRPNVISPFGSQTWSQGTPQYDYNAFNSAQNAFNNRGGSIGQRTFGAKAPSLEDFRLPGSDQWTSTVSLSPEQQQIFDAQNRVALGLAGQAESSMGQPFSLTGAMDTLSSVLEPQYQRDEDALRTSLANSGFRMGSEGFDQSMQDFQVNKDKSRAATALQAFQLASGLRTQPLTELNALRSGQQVGVPQFQGGGAVGMNPADITNPFSQQYQGQLAGYNANVGQQNSKLGAGAMLGAAALMSDRRLKSNIKRIGTHPLGIGIYEYIIFGAPDVGVMADEVEKVKPEAVINVNGYKAVLYGELGC